MIIQQFLIDIGIADHWHYSFIIMNKTITTEYCPDLDCIDHFNTTNWLIDCASIKKRKIYVQPYSKRD